MGAAFLWVRGKDNALRKRLRITEPKRMLEFIVDERPYEAGADPNYYLIDRMPEDNVKSLKVEKLEN